ncbi:MATE family efflux transporter [Fusobacterium sp.]|uniref:MATE family efflux transporter n=1 Tax=Fusobacterium sp. TaxID=68766 RepID=UPI0026339E88|nr:MATE family efflux transporter [Fusobacterium sp.]
MRKKFFKRFDRLFIKTLVILAIPIIMQNLISASLNLLDNIMIGNLGVNEIAAVGLSNQYYLLFYYTVMGISLGAGVFMSQFWGRKDIKSIKRYIGISLVFSLLLGSVFTGIAFFYPETIIGLFSKNDDVIRLGQSYLKAVALSYIFTCISVTFYVGSRSIAQTSLPMQGSIVGFVFNAVLNYIFIFGKLGFEPMGVTGAALGTTFARFAEMTFVLYKIYFRNNLLKASLSELLDFNFSTVRVYFKTAFPVIFNDFMWIAGLTLYSKAYAILGTDAIATMQIATITNNIFNIFGTGLAVASSIIIGNNIGAGKSKKSIQNDAYRMSEFCVLVGIVIGVLFFFTSPYINIFFNVSEEVKKDIVLVLRIMAVAIPFRFFGITQIIGVLRGGGDVVYAIITEILGIWIFGIPLAFISAIYFHAGIGIVYLCVCLEDVFKVAMTVPRLKSGKWIKSLI